MKFYIIIAISFLFIGCKSEPTYEVKEQVVIEPYSQTGVASYYANFFEGRKTASGDRFKQDSFTAAHRKLPLGTTVRVTNLENAKEIEVVINDRGPYVSRRIIDLSRTAAKQLGFLKDGKTKVMVEVVAPAPGYSIEDSVAVN